MEEEDWIGGFEDWYRIIGIIDIKTIFPSYYLRSCDDECCGLSARKATYSLFPAIRNSLVFPSEFSSKTSENT